MNPASHMRVGIGVIIMSLVSGMAAPGDYIVTDLNCDCLRLVNHVTGTVSNIQNGLLRASYGVAIATNGDYIVTDPYNGRLVSVSPLNGTAQIVATNLGGAGAIARDTNGNWMVSNVSWQEFYVVDPINGTVITNTISPYGYSRGVAVNLAGDYILSVEEPNRCSVPNTGYLLLLVSRTNGATSHIAYSDVGIPPPSCYTITNIGIPTGVTVDGGGNYIMTDRYLGRLIAVTPQGGTSVIAGGLGEPVGVAMDGAGNYIVTDIANHRLLRVTPQGVVSTIASSGLVLPFGVAIEQAIGTIGQDALQISAINREGDGIRVTWMTGGAGKTNALERAQGDASGGLNPANFSTIFAVTNTTGAATNYLDAGVLTNTPAMYYRIRLLP